MTTTVEALTAVADSENAAIFTYGVITAFVATPRRRMVAENAEAHRARRDEVDEAITAAGGSAPVAAAGYTLPLEVDDPVSAARAALAAELDTAVAYRALLEQADTDDARRLGVDGLTDCATRAAQWRVVLRESPATTAFPGAPD